MSHSANGAQCQGGSVSSHQLYEQLAWEILLWIHPHAIAIHSYWRHEVLYPALPPQNLVDLPNWKVPQAKMSLRSIKVGKELALKKTCVCSLRIKQTHLIQAIFYTECSECSLLED